MQPWAFLGFGTAAACGEAKLWLQGAEILFQLSAGNIQIF